MKLHSLEVRNLRSIIVDDRKRAMKADLAPGLNVVVGPNNSGKSNLIRAIALALNPDHPFDRASDLPGQLRSNAVPTITVELHQTQSNGPEATLFRYAQEYEDSVLGNGASTYAEEGRIRLQVQLRTSRSGGWSRVEQIQIRGKGAIAGDPDLRKKVVDKLHDVVRFVHVESGSDIRSLLRGRFRDILHTVLGEHLRAELDTARQQQDRFVSELQDGLLAPLSDHIHGGIDHLFEEVTNVELVPSVPTIDRMLENITIRLEDSVSTPLSGKGTGIRGGVLVALLRYLAEQSRRSIVFAIEEPEAFLHPGAQEGLRSDLLELAARADCTVIATTHSPYLIPADIDAKVIAIGKDLDGRTHIADEARGDEPKTQVMSGLFRDSGIAAVLDRALKIPLDARAILFVEGWTDLQYIQCAAGAAGRTELIKGMVIWPTEGTFRLIAEAVLTRAQTDLPIVVLVDSDKPGMEARKLLTGSRFRFNKSRQVVTYTAGYRKPPSFPLEAEDLFPAELTEQFIQTVGAATNLNREPEVCPNIKRRRWDLTPAGKSRFVEFLSEELKASHTRRWITLLDHINDCIEEQRALAAAHA